jgi:hypothetical protein
VGVARVLTSPTPGAALPAAATQPPSPRCGRSTA